MKPLTRRSPLSTAVAGASALLLSAVVTTTPAAAAGEADLFKWVSTFDVMAGNGSAVAEIVDATADGKHLIYTDSDNEAIGFVDISDPVNPVGTGLVDVGGEPTSLAVFKTYILVAVNTSPSLLAPSGKLLVLDIATRAVLAEHLLPGQPDSIAVSPNGKFAAIAIENERDEDLGGGFLPQFPGGGLAIFDLKRDPSSWTQRMADLGPVAVGAFEGADLETEYVDVSKRDMAVVSFQENNHLAIVDLRTGNTLAHFPAGSVDLQDIDMEEEDLIKLDTDVTRRREPDAVAWIDDRYFASANEGDYEDMNGVEGGSRGFTIFDRDGNLIFESAESFEHHLVAIGHYNEGRSENKGVEPEAVESGKFGGKNLLFVGSERSNVVGVYTVDKGQPELMQLLPTGIGPEGLKAIQKRNLFVASTETDEEDTGIPTMINIFEFDRGKGKGANTDYHYPMIKSGEDANGLPIPWVALSGLVADPFDPNTLYAVSDSFLAEGFIYTVDVSGKPAHIVDRLPVVGASQGLDLEGIAVGPDGSFWLGSEGNTGSRENLVLKVDPVTGDVLQEIELPADLVDMRRGNGIEGIAVIGTPGAEIIYVAIQRAWPDEGDIDEVNTKIGRFNTTTGEWGFVHYPLEPEAGGDWIGLSELTAMPDGSMVVIERDKGWGPSTGFNAELKSLYKIDLATADFRPYDPDALPGTENPSDLVTIDKTLYFDALPLLQKNSIWTSEKLEGFAVTADGRKFVVTDNDGVDGAPGETVFLEIKADD